MSANDPEVLTQFIKFVKKCLDVRKDMFYTKTPDAKF